MDLSRHCILLNGEPRTLQIDTIEKNGANGYTYHNNETVQYQRDLMKDNILSNYGLALLRLSTKGSGEREKVIDMLNKLIQ